MRVLIAGCGYLGFALGAHLASKGHFVAGIRRSAEALDRCRTAGIQPIQADFADPRQLASLPRDWDWIVHCGAPSERSESAYRRVYAQGTRELIAWLSLRPPRAFIFTSSTSVYGQDDGSIVTESTPLLPCKATAKVLVEAETVVREAVHQDFPGRIVRAAGIYGPDRNRLADFLQGRIRTGETDGRYLNLIHRDDLATALETVLSRGRDGEVYNASDGCPVRACEFRAWLAARTAGLSPQIPIERKTLEEPQGDGGKQVSVAKLRDTLGWRPQFTSFREGYTPLIAAWRQG